MEFNGVRYLSLFSGMEAAHLAWSPLGWHCVGVAEIEPAACQLLRHRLPHVPNLGDVSAISDAVIARLGRIDVVIGGSPCQDLSVAGKRAGLAGARSSLFHEQLRIFHAARHFCGARWLVWENVPGAFSSNKGRDFAVVVGALAGCELDVPVEGWGNEGVALGDSGLVEWSVLDAQWFGVAQRRRRVFAVLDTGNWADRAPVLLERDSLRGDSAPRREARQSLAGTLAGGARRSGGYSTDDVPLIAMAHGQGGAEVAYDRAPTLTCNHEAPIVAGIPEVAHTLRADGFDASKDGTRRGTPLVPCYAIQAGALRTNPESGPDGLGVQFDHAYTLEARAEVQCVAFDCRAGGDTSFSVGEVPGALCAAGHGRSAVAFTQNQRDEVRQMEVAGALAAEPGSKQQTYLQAGMQVRRLTPRECERLQGAPDDWTLVPNAQGKPMADGPRYKMLGNSFAVPVIRWIGRQIERACEVRRAAA